MDDVLSGDHSIKAAKTKQFEVIKLLKVGGFPIRKWSSNESSIIDRFPSHLLAIDPVLFTDKLTSLPVLGVSWCPQTDNFCFDIKSSEIKGLITKRTILSTLASIFDPIGWLAPVIITAKILLQSLWFLKVS